MKGWTTTSCVKVVEGCLNDGLFPDVRSHNAVASNDLYSSQNTGTLS